MKLHKKASFKNTYIFLIALLYSFVLTFIPNDIIVDRINYLNYSENSILIFLSRLNFDNIFLLFNSEPLFLIINIIINFFIKDPITSLKVLIFIFSFLFVIGFVHNKNINYYDLLFIILFPIVLLKFTVHLRQAVAMSLFYYFFNKNNLKVRMLPLLLASLVHSSFFFVLSLFLVTKVLNKCGLLFSIRVLVYIFISLLFSLFIINFFNYIGDTQRADIYINSVTKSGIIIYVWLVFLFIFILFSLKNVALQSNINIDLIIFSIIFYLIAYFYSSTAPRLFESFVPLILIYTFSYLKRYYFLPGYLHIIFLIYIISISNYIFL